MNRADDFQALTDRWREGLVALGFSDDGERLRGRVSWSGTGVGLAQAQIEIIPEVAFPFAPPTVLLVDAGAPIEPSFHIERDGALCLWEDEWPADEAPWRDPDALITRVAGWLESTAAGWPDDDSCDLERYLGQDPGMFVVYDATALVIDTAVRTRAGATPDSVIITSDARKVRDLRRGRLPRRDNRLAWVSDIGAVHRPLRNWDDVAAALGPRVHEVTRLITFGAVTLLLLRYTHGSASGALTLKVSRTTAGIRTVACESADTSAETRGLRAGPAAPELAGIRIAVVGCGAIGSFAADLLFRSKIRRLTLMDGERLRPGNLVRHLAGARHVGRNKADAVRACLADIDPDVSEVVTKGTLSDLAGAVELVRNHQVVLDATGSARASSLLATAADRVGPGSGHTVVSVCAQRAGGVVRADRMPLRGAEVHLPALSSIDDGAPVRERGCGSPVSQTPPGAVVAAAELAHRVAIDEGTRACTLPATMADVRRPQPEPPFHQPGLVTSTDRPRAVSS